MIERPDQLRRLLAPFRKKGPDGKPLYTKEERRRVYQLLLVSVIPPARFGSLPPRLQVLAGELSVASGAGQARTPKAAMDALQAYFRKNRPHPQLLADLNTVMKALAGELEDAARRSTAAEAVVSEAAGLAPPAPSRLGARGRGIPAALKGSLGALDLALAARPRR